MSTAGTPKPKIRQVSISRRSLDKIHPSPENEDLYRPVDPDDPEIIALADSIREHGVKEPLVITRDNWIISGHRRYVAAKLAGLESVPVRVEPILKDRDHDQFMQLLRECNRQRVKSVDEKVREEVISVDPAEAYRSLIEHRERQSEVDADTIEIRDKKPRALISESKFPMLNAAIEILNTYRKYRPLSVRQIHYYLLNDPPLKHEKKPNSIYTNDRNSYQDLSRLLTSAGLEDRIPWDVIADVTRPVTLWKVHSDVQPFIRSELDGFLKGYRRDLMQSQPNHIEIVGEKNTIGTIIRPLAAKFCIPMTLGRGHSSAPPKHDMAQRFKKSGKDRLILLLISDHDPDGEEIAHSFARSMRDDFGIDEIDPIRVALTAEQVERFDLPPGGKAKRGSPSYRRFVDQYGENVYELEAMDPSDLQQVLTAAIDSVIDVDAFNYEIEQEQADAGCLAEQRLMIHRVLADLETDE